MATLRLFANLRELAGTSTVEIDGATVGVVLDAATDRFGQAFAEGLGASKVWVNGDEADRTTTVAGGDEVAVIPPVSGGVTVFEDGDVTPALLGVILLATFAIANVISLEALTFAAVGGTLAWLWDLGDTQTEDGRASPVLGALVGATAAGNAAYAWGLAGFAAGLAVGLMAVLAHALYDPRLRSLTALSAGALMALTAGAGAGSLVLARAESAVYVTVLLLVVVLAAVSEWVDPALPLRGGWARPQPGDGDRGAHRCRRRRPDRLHGVTGRGPGRRGRRRRRAARRQGHRLDAAQRRRPPHHPLPGLLTALDGAVLAAATFWIAILLFP